MVQFDRHNLSAIGEAVRNDTDLHRHISGFTNVELVTSILTIVFASVGFLSTFTVLVVSVLHASIYMKYSLVVGLITIEWLYCLASLLSGIEQLSLLHRGTFGALIPAHECLQKVYPVILIFQRVAPLFLFCIAVKQFTAVCFPIFYKNHWRPKNLWHVNMMLFGVGGCEVVYAVVSLYRSNQLEPNWCSFMEWHPSKYYPDIFFCIASTIIIIITMVAFRRSRRTIVCPDDHVTAAMQARMKQNGVIRWLSLVAFFHVIFILIPTVIRLLSFTKATLFVIPDFYQHFFYLCHMFKSFLIALSTLKFKEYREAFAHLLHWKN